MESLRRVCGDFHFLNGVPTAQAFFPPTYLATETDILILGSGSAGLFFALELARQTDLRITILTKKDRSESNTNYAQGGIAGVVDKADTFESHIADTLRAGAGLCHLDAVETLVIEGPGCIEELIEIGANFTTTRSGKLELGREGGHSFNRIVHAKDLTGREIERTLIAAAAQLPSIEILEDHFAIELLTQHQVLTVNDESGRKRRCYGAYVLHEPTGKVKPFLARKAVMLATGGMGQVYLHTTNPIIATADGQAMAYRAGASIGNMEFVQFHPTTLYAPEGHSFLISEAVRGAGAVLRNLSGERFMSEYDPERMELAPRDIVARAIDAELKRRGDTHVYLDLSRLPPAKVKREFPNIASRLKQFGIDIATDQIPVVPAAHYGCGGVVTDLNGQTNILSLYAAGEVSMTGVHGANRLASNSLLEALVFSRRAARDLLAKLDRQKLARLPKIKPWDESGTENAEEWVVIAHDRLEIQQLLWDYVGIVRSTYRLERALRRLQVIRKEIESYYRKTKVNVPLLELRNVAEVALLIVRSSLRRKESRGLHYTTDYPERNDRHWLHDTILTNRTR